MRRASCVQISIELCLCVYELNLSFRIQWIFSYLWNIMRYYILRVSVYACVYNKCRAREYLFSHICFDSILFESNVLYAQRSHWSLGACAEQRTAIRKIRIGISKIHLSKYYAVRTQIERGYVLCSHTLTTAYNKELGTWNKCRCTVHTQWENPFWKFEPAVSLVVLVRYFASLLSNENWCYTCVPVQWQKIVECKIGHELGKQDSIGDTRGR